MATNDREISLRIAAQTEGNEQIRALAVELDKLAKEGGDAAPQFAALSQRLTELSTQRGLIQQFAELKRQTGESAQAFRDATAATTAAARALREKQSALAAAKAAEEQATRAMAEAKAVLQANKAAASAAAEELKALRVAIAASGSASAEQKAAVEAAKAKLVEYREAAKSAKDNVAALVPAQKQAAQTARQAGADLSTAARGFDQAKSAAAGAKSEYERGGAALQNLRNQLRATGVETTSLSTAQRLAGQETSRLTAEANRLRAAQSQLGASMVTSASRGAAATGAMASSLRSLAAPLAALAGAEQFVKTNVELENLERTFRAVTGSAERAAQEMSYVRDVSDRLGIDGIEAAKAYANLTAATKGSGVEGQKTRQVFEAVANAMSVAGKSSAETEGALRALSQMASKGVVSMEELRQQLGERLPGALQAAASGLGITTKQLTDLVASGTLTAEELFPALAKGLNDLYGASNQNGKATETLTQEWNHFKNSIADAFKTIGDAGVVKGLKLALEYLGAALTNTSVALVSAGKAIGVFFAALVNGDIGLRGFSDTAKQAFADIEKEAREKLIAAARHNEVLAYAIENGPYPASIKLALAQQKAAAATKSSGVAATQATEGWTKLNVAYAEASKKAAESVEIAEKAAKARKAEGDASLALANTFGTETEKRAAAEEATKTNAAALADVASKRRDEYQLAQQQLTLLEGEIAKKGQASEAQKKVIEGLQKTVAERKAESEQAAAQAASAQLAAAAAQTESAAYADNSARIYELRAAHLEATAAVNALREAKAAGADVSTQLAAAELRAAKASAIYRDALRDQVEAIQAAATAKQAQISVEAAGIRLAIEQQRSIYDVAKATGDEKAAAEALVQIKRLEIELQELMAESKRLEAKAALELVKAKRAELEASGQLTTAKKAELAAQEAAAKVKSVEADIASETANRLRQLENATNAAGGAARNSAGGYADMANSINRTADATERLNGVQGVGNGGGRRGHGGGDDPPPGFVKRDVSVQTFDLKQVALTRGLSLEEAKVFAETYGDVMSEEMARMSNKLRGGPQVTEVYSWLTEYSGTAERAFQRAAEMARSEIARRDSEKFKGDEITAANRRAQETASVNRSGEALSLRPININIAGKKAGTVNVASAGDAKVLESVLRQLVDDSERAY